MIGSDVFIMFPVTGGLNGDFNNNCDELEHYCATLRDTAMYECDKKFAETIERKSIGKIAISYMSDEYDSTSVEWLEAYCTLTYQKKSDLGIIVFNIPICSKEDSQIGDIVFSGHLMIRQKDGDEEPVRSFIEKIGLSSCGKEKILYCNSLERKDTDQIGYLLAGETVGSEHIDYKIRKEKLDELSAKNIAMYDFYELYASPNSIVYLLKNFTNDFDENLELEALLLYICEIAILQNAAIGRINNQIVDELMQNSNISTRKTLALQVEFGKTVLLWDNTIYNYYMSQQLSNSIVKAFGTERLLEEYERNSKHIEQIASLKSAITSDVEGKVLNVLAFIIGIGELVQLAKQAVAYFEGHPYAIAGSGASAIVLIILFLIIKRRKKRL